MILLLKTSTRYSYSIAIHVGHVNSLSLLRSCIQAPQASSSEDLRVRTDGTAWSIYCDVIRFRENGAETCPKVNCIPLTSSEDHPSTTPLSPLYVSQPPNEGAGEDLYFDVRWYRLWLD